MKMKRDGRTVLAHKRIYAKAQVIYRIVTIMTNNQLKLSKVARLCGLDYQTIRNGFHNPKRIGLERLHYIEDTLSKQFK